MTDPALSEAEHWARHWAAVAHELPDARPLVPLIAEYDDRGRRIDELTAERDRLRGVLANAVAVLRSIDDRLNGIDTNIMTAPLETIKEALTKCNATENGTKETSNPPSEQFSNADRNATESA